MLLSEMLLPEKRQHPDLSCEVIALLSWRRMNSRDSR